MNTPPDPGRFRTWLRRLLWGLGGLLVLALLLDRVIMPLYTRQGDVSLLPRVVGMPIDEARALLDSLGFPVNVEHRVDDSGPRVAADEVLEQFPRGNLQTRTGRTVHLTLSAGKSAFEMTDLRGKSERQVQVLLGDIGLEVDTLGTQWRFDEDAPGTVLKHEPRAGRSIQRGQKVKLVYSLGPRPETVEVPSLLGLDTEAARRRLQRAGLELGDIETEIQPDRPAGIRGQEPLAGSRLAPESPVSIRLNQPDQAPEEADSAEVEEP